MFQMLMDLTAVQKSFVIRAYEYNDCLCGRLSSSALCSVQSVSVLCTFG